MPPWTQGAFQPSLQPVQRCACLAGDLRARSGTRVGTRTPEFRARSSLACSRCSAAPASPGDLYATIGTRRGMCHPDIRDSMHHAGARMDAKIAPLTNGRSSKPEGGLQCIKCRAKQERRATERARLQQQLLAAGSCAAAEAEALQRGAHRRPLPRARARMARGRRRRARQHAQRGAAQRLERHRRTASGPRFRVWFGKAKSLHP